MTAHPEDIENGAAAIRALNTRLHARDGDGYKASPEDLAQAVLSTIPDAIVEEATLYTLKLDTVDRESAHFAAAGGVPPGDAPGRVDGSRATRLHLDHRPGDAQRPVDAIEPCDLVDVRDEGRCVRCGVNLHGRMFSRHHRKLRRHGDHSPANLILLCGSGTTGCHGWVHANPLKAYQDGWMLKSWQKPEEEPVLYFDGIRRRLDREGGILGA